MLQDRTFDEQLVEGKKCILCSNTDALIAMVLHNRGYYLCNVVNSMRLFIQRVSL